MDHVLDPKDQSRVSMSTAGNVTKRGELEQIDMTALLSEKLSALNCPVNGTAPAVEPDRMYHYMAAFDQCASSTRMARNQIQDLILAASDRQCRNYIAYLQTMQSSVSFATGALGTITGGLSAIFTNASVARALGGSSAILYGVGAEFNEAYFRDQLVGVLLSGINMELRDIHGQIEEKQKKMDYTLEGALKDAIRYNSACSLPVAVDRLKLELAVGRHVGLDVADDVLIKVGKMAAHNDLRIPTKQEEAKKYLNAIEELDEKARNAKAAQIAIGDSLVIEEKIVLASQALKQAEDTAKTAGDAVTSRTSELQAADAAAAAAVTAKAANEQALKSAAAEAKTKFDAATEAKSKADAAVMAAKANLEFLKDLGKRADERKLRYAALPDIIPVPDPLKLDGNAIAAIITLAQGIQAQGKKAVILTGQADATGDTDANKMVSARRAQAVKAELDAQLEKLGYSHHVTVSASGAGDSLARKNKVIGADPSYRRVDVKLIP